MSATCSDNDTCDTWVGNMSDILCQEDGEGDDYLYKVANSFEPLLSFIVLMFNNNSEDCLPTTEAGKTLNITIIFCCY